jgi:hypothetical protein
MTELQEIRAKAPELTVRAIALMPESARIKQLSADSRPATVIIELSRDFENYLKRTD